MAQLMDDELADRAGPGRCGPDHPLELPAADAGLEESHPALAMGNTVVLKPAEYTSLTALAVR